MVEGSLPFRTGGMPPPGRGIPLSGRDIPPGGRGIPPAGRGIPPPGRGIPPAGRGMPPGVQLMIQAGRGIPPAGHGIPAATEEIFNNRYNLYLISTHDNTSIDMSTDDANVRPRTEEVLTNSRVNLTVPTTITNNVPETPMRTLNVSTSNGSRRNVSTSNVSSRNWRARITPYSKFLPR